MEKPQQILEEMFNLYKPKKPQQILELEKIINKEINICPPFQNIMEMGGVCTFLLKDNKITGLNLRGCNLKNLKIISTLKDLTELDLRDNFIDNIDEINNLSNLEKLNLSKNKLYNIDSLNLKKLKRLTLRFNKIEKISNKILYFELPIYWEWKDESGIYLEGNPLQSPPPEIIKQGNAAIKAYFDSLKIQKTGIKITCINNNNLSVGDNASINLNSAKKLNELKILFVGDGGAGKTSLCKALRGEPFDAQENQTHGINIHHWQQNDLTLHLWDFGGQEIMHATHQFFLSKRSLYILVLDGRKEEDAEYWLKHIQSFGGDSPVLVVLNKTDEHPAFDLNRQHLLSKYPNIQGFYKLSCKNNLGFNDFQTGFQQAFAKVEMLQTTWGGSWFNVKTELEDLQKNLKKNYITCEEYHAICNKEEIADNQTQEILAQYLHDLGIIVHFADFELNDTHILEPRWITEAVYKIINSKQLAEKQGLLCLNDLAVILKKETDSDFDYPKEKYRHIIKLMEKFELCYRVNDNHILMPDLLSIQQPKFELTETQLLRFRLKYDFLPKSIMPRFIVKLHEKIKGELRWRTGVVLYDKELKATALIRSDDHDKLIDIQVEGEQKRDFFAVIRNTLNEIHKSFEKLEITELVPLPDYPDICIEYAELIGYELDGEDNYRVGKLRKVYSVSELLDGIEKPENRKLKKEVIESTLRTVF